MPPDDDPVASSGSPSAPLTVELVSNIYGRKPKTHGTLSSGIQSSLKSTGMDEVGGEKSSTAEKPGSC